MATRVAAELSKDGDVEVEKVKGGFGEFSVSIDGEKLIDTHRLWYPTPGKVVAKTKSRLAEPTS